MTRRNTVRVLSMVPAAALSIFAHAAESAKPLTAEEILTKVIGNTIEFQNDQKDQVRMYLDRDGNIYGKSRVGGQFKQAWQIRFGNDLCFVADDPTQSGCAKVVLLPNGQIEMHRHDDVIEGPFKFLPGKAGV